MAAQQALLYVLYMKDKEFIRDMRKEYINMNVFDALQKRFAFLFQEFKNIYISFSGGKDSGVLLNLLLDYRNKYASDRVIGVFHHNMTAFPCHGLSGKRWFVSGCAYAIYFVKLVFLDMFKTVTTCNTKYHYTCGLALQQNFDWLVDLPKERVLRKSNNVEIVFEEQDFDGFLNKLKKYPDIEYLGEVIEHSWGQRVIRFYDLDGHIVEVGEDMKMVLKRFLASSVTMEEISVKMDASVEDLIKLMNS